MRVKEPARSDSGRLEPDISLPSRHHENRTGADGRSERTKGKRFGDEDYAKEELVAELGSAFLCQRFNVDGALQHPEYLRTWLSALKGDKRFLFQAASKARQALEWIDALPSQQTAEVAAGGATGSEVAA